MRKFNTIFPIFGLLALIFALSTLVYGVVSAQTSTQAEDNEGFIITREEVEALNGSTVMFRPQDVSTTEDLKEYALSAIRADSKLESVAFNGESVELSYRQDGTLFGLVPISFVVLARADAGGDVELIYPWFSIITIDNSEEVDTVVDVAASTALAARTVGSVRAEGEPLVRNLSPRDSAELLEAIRAALESQGNVSGNIGTNVVR